jgi:UDP:flavonoid glycosyltransferase YjiC (YdhE family)
MFRTLFLNQCPPLLQMQVACSAVRYALLRPALYDGADAWNGPALPLWDSPAHPLLFVTLGTVPAFYREPRIFQAIIDGLHNQPMNAVIAAGIDNPLVQSGDVPRNVQITGFVPQSLLNPQLAVVICHGGPGTTISALSHGIPLLLIPRGGAVQVRVAAACERAGVARVLSSGEVTAEGVRANVRELIENPSYRAAARQLAAQIEAMPDHDAAICQIERGVNSYHTTPIHDAAATQGLY